MNLVAAYELFFFVLFLYLIITGYRRHNRNRMLGATLCLFLSVASVNIAENINKGYVDARNKVSSTE